MYESKGLCSSVKKVNENAGFTTPFGKSCLTSRKIVFPTENKIAFGDLKNMNTSYKPTPFKSTQTSKVKQDDFNAAESAPKSNKPFELNEMVNQVVEEELIQGWNDNLVLTDRQFELLFLNPNENIAPPTPPPIDLDRPTTPIDLDFLSYLETSGHKYNFESGTDDNYDEIPALNLSCELDSWNEESPKENDQNIINFF